MKLQVLVNLLLVIAILVISVGLFAFQNNRRLHPYDAVLEKTFWQYENDFNQLVIMSNIDSKVVRIAPDFTWLESDASWPRPESKIGFSNKRWSEYRYIFNKLGLHQGLLRYSDIDIIYLTASSYGLVTGGSSKGYAYSRSELSPLVDSLDHITIEVKSLEPVYKKIKDNWYLYYEWDD